MIMAVKKYDNYPIWIPILSFIFMIIIYALGAYILSGFGILWVILYLIYCIIIEALVLKRSCVNCYYYGKVCGLGKGKICAKIFKRGDPQKFREKEVSFKEILPDFLTLIFPLIGGIILLIINFTVLLLLFLIIFISLYLSGNALIRGSLACKYCKQGELGCPALKAFQKVNAIQVEKEDESQ